jgi:Na+-driven multidrug efflux pump
MFALNTIAVINSIINATITSLSLPGYAFFYNSLLSGCMITAIYILAHCLASPWHVYVGAFTLSQLLVAVFASANLYQQLKQYFPLPPCDIPGLIHIIQTIWRYFSTIALPVFASWLVILWGANLLNTLLASGGETLVAGFGLVYRLQMIIYQPALAMGLAMAILINQAGYSVHPKYSNTIALAGLLCSVMFYMFLGVTLFFARTPLAGLLTSQTAVQHVIAECLYYLAPSWLCIGPLLALLMLLEQTGYALSVLCLNLAYFIFVGLAGHLLIHDGAPPNNLFLLFAYANYAALGIGSIFFLIVKYKEKGYVHSPAID